MNRQKIRVVALAALVVAAGAYVWAQRTASTVKPAQTSNVTINKPANAAPAAAPAATNPATAAKPANTAAPTPPAPAPATAAQGAAKASTPAPAATARPAAVDAKASNVAAAAAAAPMPPAAKAAPAAVLPAASVEAADWHDHLQKGAYLAEQLRTRLPAGTDLASAAAGFRDLQQFVAAVTAAHNLTLNFDELKRRVVTDGKGLAPAIDAMKKVASPTLEEQRAEYEARGLIQEANRRPLPAREQPKKKPATGRS